MATYTTVNTLRRDLWGVTDDEVLGRVMNRAAELAYNHINRYLYGIYSVPFSPTPADIADISDVLTKAYALALSARTTIKVEELAEYKMANDAIADIASGKAHVIGSTRLATRGAQWTMQCHQPIFDLDDSMNHQADKDYLDDVQDRRDDA